jgi:hypothetical protein
MGSYAYRIQFEGLHLCTFKRDGTSRNHEVLLAAIFCTLDFIAALINGVGRRLYAQLLN